jgi:hypothetical protein
MHPTGKSLQRFWNVFPSARRLCAAACGYLGQMRKRRPDATLVRLDDRALNKGAINQLTVTSVEADVTARSSHEGLSLPGSCKSEMSEFQHELPLCLAGANGVN